MPPSNSALLARALLLVVDLQAPFVSAVAEPAALLQRTRLAIAAARGLGMPIAFTEQVPAKLGPTRPELLALAGQPAVFSKNAFSAFAAAGLADFLAVAQTEHVLLAGIETPVCIYQSALDALAAGLQVTLLTDCLGGRRPDDCAAVLAQLARLGCHPLPVETVFYSILKSTTHPFFRDFTGLVKRHGAAPPATPCPCPPPT